MSLLSGVLSGAETYPYRVWVQRRPFSKESINAFQRANVTLQLPYRYLSAAVRSEFERDDTIFRKALLREAQEIFPPDTYLSNIELHSAYSGPPRPAVLEGSFIRDPRNDWPPAPYSPQLFAPRWLFFITPDFTFFRPAPGQRFWMAWPGMVSTQGALLYGLPWDSTWVDLQDIKTDLRVALDRALEEGRA